MAGLSFKQALYLFELSWPFTQADLKARFKALVKRWHPDCRPVSDRHAHARFLMIQQGFTLLTRAAF
ncbi:MAG: hypothetical protein ACKO37_03100 [Vampirovibrionales bacterium]